MAATSGAEKHLHEALACSDSECAVEHFNIDFAVLRPEDDANVARQVMHEVAQLDRSRRGYKAASRADEERITRCRAEPRQCPAHGGRA